MRRTARAPALLLMAVAFLATAILFPKVDPGTRVAALVLLGIIASALVLSPFNAYQALAGAALVWVVTYAAMKAVPDVVHISTSVAQSAGYAAYVGVDYQSYQLALGVGLILALGIGALMVWGLRRWLPVEEQEAVEQEIEEEKPWQAVARSPVVLVVVAAVLAVTVIPDPKVYFGPIAYPYSWDSANVIAWNSLIQQGLAPMQDFFYPYGGQWLFEAVPTGAFFRWLAQAATLAIVAWSLWRISGRQTIRVCLCLLAVVLVGTWSDQYLWRYLPGLAIGLSYAALPPLRSVRPSLAHLIFGLACLFATFLEADLLLYGLAAVGLVIVGELVTRPALRSLGLKRLSLALLLEIGILLAAAGIVVLIWVLTGAASGNLRFFLGARAVSAASALNPVLSSLVGYSLKPGLNSVIMATPGLLALSGLFLGAFGGSRVRRAAPVLLVASGFAFILAIKDINRFIGDQVLILVVLSLAWTVILTFTLSKARVVIAATVFLVAVGTVFREAGVFDVYANEAIRSPVRSVRLALTPFESGEISQVADERFDRRNFLEFPDVAVAEEYERAEGGSPPSFAVLGDAQLLYAFFEEDPPYMVDLYDASPIAEQEEVVSRLERERPSHIVWANNEISQDGVPYQVRNPLIYSYFVTHYVPESGSGTTRVLRLRRPGEPIPAAWWRRELGPLDLAFIPSLSSGVSAPECDDGSGCNSYVVLEGPEPDSVDVLGVRLGGPRGYFEVKLRSQPGQTRYAIRLDRLWFAPLLGPNPTVLSEIPDWEARIRDLQTGDDLY